MQVWCLTEGGAVFGKTIRSSQWEEHEAKGYKQNPLHLPGSVKRISDALVVDKKNCVVRPNSVKGLKKRIENIITNKKLQNHLIKDTYIKEKEFSWSKIAKKIEKIYKEK